jgi:hypothetical protein
MQVTLSSQDIETIVGDEKFRKLAVTDGGVLECLPPKIRATVTDENMDEFLEFLFDLDLDWSGTFHDMEGIMGVTVTVRAKDKF